MEFGAVCTILSAISTLTAFLFCAVPVINPLALHNEGDWGNAIPRTALRCIKISFRGLLTEREAGCAVCSGTMLEKAMRRLRSQKADTVVFTGTLALVESAKAAGFRAVAVGGAAGEDEWRQMCALADYELPHYEDWLRLE